MHKKNLYEHDIKYIYKKKKNGKIAGRRIVQNTLQNYNFPLFYFFLLSKNYIFKR